MRCTAALGLLLGCGEPGTHAGDGGTDDASTSSSTTAADTTTGPSGPVLPPRGDTQPCRFEGRAPGMLPELALASALTVEDPIDMVPADADGTVYIASSDGRLAIGSTQDGTVAPLVDLSARGRPVALAVPPDHADTGHLFVRYEAAVGVPRTVISRLTVDREAGTADPASERVVLELDDAVGERSGGALVFGGDGMLYVGVGDMVEGEGSLAPQDVGSRLGKLLRIDVAMLDALGTYAIPPDNPFIGQGGHADEVWAIGLRDPWRCTAIADAPELWCVDRGALEQEIDRVHVRDNLGWPYVDGRTCLLDGGDCSDLGVAGAVASYPTREPGCGIAGVVAASDTEQPELAGTLLFADRCSGELWGLALDSDGVSQSEVLGIAATAVTAIAQEGRGRSFALTEDDGIARLTVVPPVGEFPTRLSDSGCFDDLATLTPAHDVLPYAVNAELWSDGATKQRFVALPPGETVAVDDDGMLALPRGTVLLKNFSFELRAGDAASARPFETRVMVLAEHGWQFHTYRWNDDGSDAELLTHGEVHEIALDDHGTPVRFDYEWPARGTCKVCHGLDPARPLGLRVDQLNGELDYGSGVANQLLALGDIGVFAEPLPEPSSLPRIPAHDDADEPLESRARGWLHGNCGHCHRPGGWAPPLLTMDLRYTTATADTNTCGVPLQYYNAWVQSDIRIVAGDAEGSAIWQRLQMRGDGQMPPLGTHRVDPRADVVGQWIDALPACP